MKRYASLWLLAICLTCGAVQLQAQEPEPRAEQKELPREVPSPEKAAQRITDQMQKELQLTDKQYKKVYKLNLKEQKKIFSTRLAGMRPPMGAMPDMNGERPPMPMGEGGMMPGMGGGRPPMGGPGMPHMAKDSAEELQKAAASKEKKLKKILTEEQFAKWQKMRDEQKPPRRPHNNAEAPQKDKI